MASTSYMMPVDHSYRIWSAAAQEVLDGLTDEKDDFKPSTSQLIRFAIHDDEATMITTKEDFFKRCNIVYTAFKVNTRLPTTQGHNLLSSLHQIAMQGNLKALKLYRQKARQVHQTMTELLHTEAKAPVRETAKRNIASSSASDDMECIICLDDIANYIYTPCEHTVACLSCAQGFWQKSSTCPWCRTEVAQPE